MAKRSIAVLLLPVAAVLAAVAVAAGSPRSHTQARMTRCHPAPVAIDRSLTVAARVRAIAGTRRMGIRFDLLERGLADARFHRVSAPGFGVWFRSDRGASLYRYFRTVNNLVAPATYRMRVGFRWYGRRGRVLATTYRTTRSCRQPDPHPDLRIADVLVRATATGGDRYVVVVRNAGPMAAGPFAVALALPGGTKRKAVAGLAARAVVRVPFAGPACRSLAAPPQATVDPFGQIDESDEGDNNLAAACPAGQ